MSAAGAAASPQSAAGNVDVLFNEFRVEISQSFVLLV